MADAIGTPYLLIVPRVAVYIALAAWLVVLLGLVQSVVSPLVRADEDPPSTR